MSCVGTHAGLGMTDLGRESRLGMTDSGVAALAVHMLTCLGGMRVNKAAGQVHQKQTRCGQSGKASKKEGCLLFWQA